MMELFILNPPRGKGGKRVARRRGSTRRRRRNPVGKPKAARGRAYRSMVKRYGVVEGARRWRQRKRKPAKAGTRTRRRRRTRSRSRRNPYIPKVGTSLSNPRRSRRASGSGSSTQRARRRRRSMARRNAWRGDRRGHSRAAKKGWRRRKRRRARRNPYSGKRRTSRRSPARSRRTTRRRNPVASNPRRRRRAPARRYRRNPSRRSRYSRNRAGTNVIRQIQDVFTLDTLTNSFQGAVGIAGTLSVSKMVLGAVRKTEPAAGQIDFVAHITNAVTAGVLGAVGSFWSRAAGQNVMAGGLAVSMSNLLADLVNPNLPDGIDFRFPKIEGVGDNDNQIRRAIEAEVMRELSQGQNNAQGAYLTAGEARRAVAPGAPQIPGVGAFLTAQDLRQIRGPQTQATGVGVPLDLEGEELF